VVLAIPPPLAPGRNVLRRMVDGGMIKEERRKNRVQIACLALMLMAMGALVGWGLGGLLFASGLWLIIVMAWPE